MTDVAELADRGAFRIRIRRQLQARHHGLRVEDDDRRFGLRLRGQGLDAFLPLGPLHHAVLRDPDRAAATIARWVNETEAQAVPAPPLQLSVARLLWCVRSTAYLDEHNRSGELLVRSLGGDLVAFVAEELPNSIMRGVPRAEWAAEGDEAVAAAADRHTTQKFAVLPERIRTSGRVPRDGWSLTSDPLFMGSALVVPAVLAAFAERAGGDVLLATPDRGQVLAVAAGAPGAADFPRRVVRAWREAMHGCSRTVLRTDGSDLEALTAPTRDQARGLLRRLRGA